MPFPADRMPLFQLSTSAGFGVVVTIILIVVAWLTHVVVSINAGAYLLLVAGAVFAPLGIVHGVGVWFGVF